MSAFLSQQPIIRLSLLALLSVLVNACSTLQSQQQAETGVVAQWNELALTAVRNEAVVRPTTVSRQLFLLHASMYDAWSAFSPHAKPYALDPTLKAPADSVSEAAKVAAVSQAAYQILRREYPRFESNTEAFKGRLVRLGVPIVNEGDPATPEGIGYLAAQAVLQARAKDGAVHPQSYEPVNSDDPRAAGAPGQPGFNPNHWQPLRVPYPSTPRGDGRFRIDHDNRTTYDVQFFLAPNWGAVKPFALASGAEFRPPPPPQLGSNTPYVDALGRQTTNDQAYREQAAEVLRINAELTERQKVIAEFWADGPRTESPPGHWNQLAHGLSERDNHSLDDDVKMYFALNAALLDAGIACWESKRYYDYVRPVSAIHHLYYNQTIQGWGGPNRGTETMLGQAWQPYQQQTFLTPGFPEYVSGHSTFSAAAATVLILFTGSDRFYDGVTRTQQDIDRDGEPDLLGQYIFRAGAGFYEKVPSADVVLHWPTLKDAADEAGMSRRYGGIHFQDGDLRGRELGRKIGEVAYAKARGYWE